MTPGRQARLWLQRASHSLLRLPPGRTLEWHGGHGVSKTGFSPRKRVGVGWRLVFRRVRAHCVVLPVLLADQLDWF